METVAQEVAAAVVAGLGVGLSDKFIVIETGMSINVDMIEVGPGVIVIEATMIAVTTRSQVFAKSVPVN